MKPSLKSPRVDTIIVSPSGEKWVLADMGRVIDHDLFEDWAAENKFPIVVVLLMVELALSHEKCVASMNGWTVLYKVVQ